MPLKVLDGSVALLGEGFLVEHGILGSGERFGERALAGGTGPGANWPAAGTARPAIAHTQANITRIGK